MAKRAVDARGVVLAEGDRVTSEDPRLVDVRVTAVLGMRNLVQIEYAVADEVTRTLRTTQQRTRYTQPRNGRTLVKL